MVLSLFFIVIAYLIGSICSAIIVCQACSLPDPRSEGSKNPGATNVLRLAGKKYATLVLLADVLKGVIPVVIARIFLSDPMIIGFVALAAVIGHIYPVFFDFKGGKGVATAIGALLGFQFIVGVMVIATWLLVARFTRYSSLASLISIGLSPFYALMIVARIEIVPPLFFIVLLILFKHRNNINRLIDKTEPKLQLKQSSVLEEIMGEEPTHPVPETNTEEPIVPELIEGSEKKKAPAKNKKPAAKKTKVARPKTEK
jgi:glycerol-3-phosphate acyltransferase PlsY